MNTSWEILLKLVRVAMGWEKEFSLPEDIDWEAVLQLSHEQGVNAIVLDGLEKLMEETSYSFPPKDKLFIIDAIGSLQIVEHNTLNQLAALKDVAAILHAKQIPFMIMKGFACGQYYPEPRHRPCGDIDIYPGGKYEESNQAFCEAGIVSNPYYYRHSALSIRGVMIENHKILGSLRWSKKETREFEAWLEREAKKSIETGTEAKVLNEKIPGGVFPNADFNALFLPWHVSAHFAFERVTIRHLLDWALFLSNEGKSINVAQFREAKKRFIHGYSKIAEIMTNLSVRYLNMPVTNLPKVISEDAMRIDSGLADKVLVYMFEGQLRERDEKLWKSRWNNLKRIWKERWKYKEVYNMSPAVFMLHQAKGVLFRIGES